MAKTQFENTKCPVFDDFTISTETSGRIPNLNDTIWTRVINLMPIFTNESIIIPISYDNEIEEVTAWRIHLTGMGDPSQNISVSQCTLAKLGNVVNIA